MGSSDLHRPRRIRVSAPGDPPAATDDASAQPACPFVPPAERPSALAPEAAAPEAAADTSDQELARLQQTLTELEGRCTHAEDQHLRVVAELQNYKRLVQQEKEQLARFANEGLLVELIPILDNFERAMQVEVDSAGAECLMTGVRMIYDQLQRALAAHGVERIDALGADFDPHLHEAIEREETAALPPNVVVAELAKGYRLNGRIIRPARVRVTAAPE